MVWVEESVVDSSWVEEAQGAFQANAFQPNAFQIGGAVSWSEQGETSNTWAEESEL